MMEIEEAQRILLGLVRPLRPVTMPLREALYRTLAEPVRCDTDYPPFDRAVMDGYAVRAADVAGASVTLPVAGTIAAGSPAPAAMPAGQAMQINTGAPIPSGADAVVRLEDTEASPDGGAVRIRAAARSGTFITHRGEYIHAGQTVLEPGTRLTPTALAAAAAVGAAKVAVYPQPRVAVLSTGNELVDIDQTPAEAQIRNSNQYLLESLARSAQAAAAVLGTARDDVAVLQERITAGLEADVLCISGGVSMGALDLVPGVLRELGAEFHVHRISIKPGRPTIFATAPGGTLIFALPGNPASALVGFELLVRPALAALEGRSGCVPAMVKASLRGAVKATESRRTYLPAVLRSEASGELAVEPLSWAGSGDLFGMARADALIVRLPGSPAANTGDRVLIHLLGREPS